MSQKEGFITTSLYKYGNIELGVPVETSTNQKMTKTFDWLTGKRAPQKSGFELDLDYKCAFFRYLLLLS